MDLTPADWFRAQDLLLKLVQTLTPLTDRTVSSSAFLTKRFFHFPPPSEESRAFHLQHSVRVLTTIQEQVEKWIGEPHATQSEGPSIENGEKPPSTENPPLSKQAQRLIDQVQGAIGKLISSSNIKDPQQEPLRDVLKRLKPHLDRLIEAVTHEGMHSADDLPSPFRFSSSHSLHKAVIQKSIPFPEAQHPLPSKAIQSATVGQADHSEGALEEVGEAFRERSQKRGEEEMQKSHFPAHFPTGAKPLPVREENPIPLGAPFTPEVRNPPSARKKKKRKSFWFREEDPSTNS